jgi:adiponectin receptor
MSGSNYLNNIIDAYQVFSRLDYAGINILISGSSFPALYFGMYCNFSLVIFYLIFICSLGITLFILTLFKYLHRPENFVLKSLAYGGFAVSLAIPLGHGIVNEVIFNNYGDSFSIKSSMVYYVFGAISYIFGLYVYTVRCPERHYQPGKFNVCGNSHQIWHLLVVCGIISTYLGAL